MFASRRIRAALAVIQVGALVGLGCNRTAPGSVESGEERLDVMAKAPKAELAPGALAPLSAPPATPPRADRPHRTHQLMAAPMEADDQLAGALGKAGFKGPHGLYGLKGPSSVGGY